MSDGLNFMVMVVMEDKNDADNRRTTRTVPRELHYLHSALLLAIEANPQSQDSLEYLTLIDSIKMTTSKLKKLLWKSEDAKLFSGEHA